MEMREKYTRQFLRFSCDSKETLCPDFSFVCSDGIVFAHKFMVLGFMPELQQLLGGICQDGHEEIKIIMTDVTKAELEMARDFLYMFGDAGPFVKIFKGEIVKDTNIKNTKEKSPKKRRKDNSNDKIYHTKESNLYDEGERVENLHDFSNRKEKDDLPRRIHDILADWKSDIDNWESDKSNIVFDKENILVAISDEENDYIVTEKTVDFEPDLKGTKIGDEGNDASLEIYTLGDVIQKKIKSITSTCSVCGYTTKNQGNFSQHVKTHSNIVYSCDECDFKGRNEKSFKSHKLRHSIGKVSCVECDFQGLTKSSVRYHVLRKHRGFRNTCDLCDYTSVSTISMKEHYKGIHQGIKYECNKCEYTTVAKNALNKHIEVKHIGVRFPCKFCEFLASSKNSVNRHVATKHPNLLIESLEK